MIFIAVPPNYIMPSVGGTDMQTSYMKQNTSISAVQNAVEKQPRNTIQTSKLTTNTPSNQTSNSIKQSVVNNQKKELDDFSIPPQYCPCNVTNCTYCGIAAQTYQCSYQFPICKNCIKIMEQAVFTPQVLYNQPYPCQLPSNVQNVQKGLDSGNNTAFSKVHIQSTNSPDNNTSLLTKLKQDLQLIRNRTQEIVDPTLKRKNIVWCSTCNKREALCTKDRQYKTCLQCCRKKRNRYRKRKREYSDLAYI